MTPDARRGAWRGAAGAILVAALTVLVFWPCLRLGLVDLDDPVNLAPAALGRAGASLSWLFSNVCCNYSPVSQSTFAADFALWGGAPLGYHLTSVLLHAANAAAFYALCLELFAAGRPSGRDRLGAAAAALLFALHPLRVQSVAWVSGRRDVVCGLFFLLTLLCWLRAQRPGEARAGRWRAGALALFLLALLSKAAALALPPVLVLLSVHPLGRPPASPRRWSGEAARAVWRETAPFFALAAAFAPVAVLGRSQCGAFVGLARALPAQRARQILIGLVFYTGKTLWPSGLSLYEWNWAPIRSATWLGAAATAGLIAAAVVSRRLRPHLLAALGYQTLMLAPTLAATFGHEIVADRYSYLSGLAWAALAGAGLRGLSPRRRLPGTAVLAAALILCAVLTRAQASVWTDSTSLWRQVLRVDPMSWGARPNLAEAVLKEGRLGEGVLLLEEQLRVYPDDAQVREALARLIASTKTTARDHARFHAELGREFAERGEFVKAAWHFERALRYDPESTALRAELDAARAAAVAR